MKPSELRDKSVEELTSLLNDTQKQLFQLKNESRISKKQDKPHLLPMHKKDIARLHTVIREKQLNNQE